MLVYLLEYPWEFRLAYQSESPLVYPLEYELVWLKVLLLACPSA